MIFDNVQINPDESVCNLYYSLQMNKLTKAAHWPTGLPGLVYCKLTVLIAGEDALTMHELLYLPEGIANHYWSCSLLFQGSLFPQTNWA